VVAGTNFLVDVLTNWSGTFGGRSVLYQQELDHMQKQLLGELAHVARRQIRAGSQSSAAHLEAARSGADALGVCPHPPSA
jgi:hypothetical protein